MLGLAFAAVTYDMFKLTRASGSTGGSARPTRWCAGRPADRSIQSPGPSLDIRQGGGDSRSAGASTADLQAVLPAGSRCIPSGRRRCGCTPPPGSTGISAYGVDVADPLTHGLVNLVQGRAPAADDQVALTAQALDRLGRAPRRTP